MSWYTWGAALAMQVDPLSHQLPWNLLIISWSDYVLYSHLLAASHFCSNSSSHLTRQKCIVGKGYNSTHWCWKKCEIITENSEAYSPYLIFSSCFVYHLVEHEQLLLEQTEKQFRPTAEIVRMQRELEKARIKLREEQLLADHFKHTAESRIHEEVGIVLSYWLILLRLPCRAVLYIAFKTCFKWPTFGGCKMIFQEQWCNGTGCL